MRNKAILNFREPGMCWNNIQLIVKEEVVTYVIILNTKEMILNVLQQLRLSLYEDNDGSLTITVKNIEYPLDYLSWIASLYVLEHWFEGMLSDDWDVFNSG